MALNGEFLTTSEVADLLGVSKNRVLQFRERKKNPLLEAEKVGNILLFRKRDVLRFAAKPRPNGRPKNNV